MNYVVRCAPSSVTFLAVDVGVIFVLAFLSLMKKGELVDASSIRAHFNYDKHNVFAANCS